MLRQNLELPHFVLAGLQSRRQSHAVASIGRPPKPLSRPVCAPTRASRRWPSEALSLFARPQGGVAVRATHTIAWL